MISAKTSFQATVDKKLENAKIKRVGRLARMTNTTYSDSFCSISRFFPKLMECQENRLLKANARMVAAVGNNAGITDGVARLLMNDDQMVRELNTLGIAIKEARLINGIIAMGALMSARFGWAMVAEKKTDPASIYVAAFLIAACIGAGKYMIAQRNEIRKAKLAVANALEKRITEIAGKTGVQSTE